MYIEMMQSIQSEPDATDVSLSVGNATPGSASGADFAQVFSEARAVLMPHSSTEEASLVDGQDTANETDAEWSPLLALLGLNASIAANAVPVPSSAATEAGGVSEDAVAGANNAAATALSVNPEVSVLLDGEAPAADSQPSAEGTASSAVKAALLAASESMEVQPLVVADMDAAMAHIPKAVPAAAEYEVTASPARNALPVEGSSTTPVQAASKAEYVVLPSVAASETGMIPKTAKAAEGAAAAKAAVAASETPVAAAPLAKTAKDTPMPAIALPEDSAQTEAAEELPAVKPSPKVEVKPLPAPDFAPSQGPAKHAAVNPALFAQTLESDTVAVRMQKKTVGHHGEDMKAAVEVSPRLTGVSTEVSSTPSIAGHTTLDMSKTSGALTGGQTANTTAALERPTLQTLDAFTVKSVRYLAQQGGATISVRLIPESLGEMHIEVRSQGDDVSVRLVSANPVVRETLQTQLPGLRDALARDGLEVGQVEIASSTSQNAGQGSWNSQQAGPQDGPARIPAYSAKSYAGPVHDTMPALRRLPAHQGALNVFV